VWLPAALISKTPFQKTLSNGFSADGGTAGIVEFRANGLGIIAAEFPAGVKPVLTLTSRVATKNYAVDLSMPGKAPKADCAELEHFLRPTRLLPTDGIVKATATNITGGAKTDLEKARAIDDWIVDNTFRDPKTRGRGSLTASIRTTSSTRSRRERFRLRPVNSALRATTGRAARNRLLRPGKCVRWPSENPVSSRAGC
jgi:hypothetical protein